MSHKPTDGYYCNKGNVTVPGITSKPSDAVSMTNHHPDCECWACVAGEVYSVGGFPGTESHTSDNVCKCPIINFGISHVAGCMEGRSK